MEDTQVLDSNYGAGGELSLTGQSISFIRETAKWGTFLSIVGFIFIGLMVLLGIFMGSIMGSMGGIYDEIPGMGGMGGFLGVFYILIALLYFYPTLQLFKFSKMAKQAIAANDTGQMTIALGHMKSMFKFMGIFTAIIIGLYALLFIFGLLASMFA